MSEVLPLSPPAPESAQVAAAGPAPAEQPAPVPAAPRLRPINRELRSTLSLDELLPADHLARLVWAYVQELDLSAFYANLRARVGVPGRNATDPALLVALWLYTTLDGVSSARYLDDLCRYHLAYQWLCGGVSLNYHTLSAFRVDHQDLLDDLFSDSIACFQQEGLITLERTAQDGLKVRAAAGECSLRREETLREALDKARQYLQQLQEQQDVSGSKQQRAAQKRAALDRVERLKAALATLEEIKQQRQERNRKEEKDKEKEKPPRASKTDPEARKMRMPDGGYRVAYNAQLNTEVGAGLIVGVDVSSEGNDTAEMLPMLAQMEERYEQTPAEHLVDGGFVNKDQIEEAAQEYKTTVYAPLKEEKKQLEAGKNPYKPKRGDTPAVAAWRARMGTPAAKELYKKRASTAEWVNAQARNRGFYQVTVRGKKKVLAVLLWYALAHNLVRAMALRAAKAEASEAKAETARAI
jgi:transposase